MTHLQQEFKHLRIQVAQHQKNLFYLMEQAAQYGASGVPLELHNKIMQEQETLDTHRARLNTLIKDNPQFEGAGSRLIPKSPSDAENCVLVVEDDMYWSDIISDVATAMGYGVNFYKPLQLLQDNSDIFFDRHVLGVIGVPTPEVFTESCTVKTWAEAIAQVGQLMPIILLTQHQSTPVSLATRQALRQKSLQTMITIQKETFNHAWFVKMFKEAIP